ncbi:MAG: putative gamma-glutamylcyclotransferase [Prokaryotic dsDNA virus sp.]|nr:MAG: putative gamma-glutamylcyclotransferase [Prokaryotic dsDNA virus sp.]|tara:strand:- start:20584 stop:20994 length:411 start_codon:yes stop_codon:yes gene_type:complete
METDKVFVYGTLKKNHSNSHLLESSVYIGEAESVSKFKMVNLGGFPAILYNSDEGYKISGEIYQITPNTLHALDILEGEGTFYKRVLDDFFIISNIPTKNGQSYKCYVYILKDMPSFYDYNNIYINTKNLLTYERI